MFQQGGMVTPSMPLPPSGGIVDGLGLNAPEAMPPIPPQDQEILTEGISDMAVKLGQVDAAEDTASLINAIRSDNATIDDRYTELAKYVGREDATKTPDSVLTLVQPTFELIEQGGGMNMLGSDLLQGTGPMEESMSATLTETPMGDTATMTETMETPTLFNKGGLAVKKSKAPVYRSNGSPMIGEMMTDYTQGSPYRFGELMKTYRGDTSMNTPDVYFPQRGQPNTGANPPVGFQTLGQQYADLNAPMSGRLAIAGGADFANRAQRLQPPTGPSYNEMINQGMQNFRIPTQYTEAGLRETMTQGMQDPRSATELLEEYEGMADDRDLLTTKSAAEYQAELDALMAPTAEKLKTPEELLQERQDFVGDIDRSPEALFALAQSFNQLAQTPGTFLQGVAAFGGDAAERLAPMSREQELLERQMKSQAFDESRELAERIRQEDRSLAESAYEMFRTDEQGTKAMKQGLFSTAIQQAAIEAQTAQELNTRIKELSITLGVDLRTAQIDALQKMYEPMLETEVTEWGGLYKMIPDENGDLVRRFVGVQGEDVNQYFNQRHALRGDNPMVIVADSDAPPQEVLENMGNERILTLRDKIGAKERAINDFESLIADIYRSDGQIGTGPASFIKALATNSLGAFGADGFTFIQNENQRRQLLEAIRSYQRAETMNPRYPIGEMERIENMVDLDPQFFASPEATYERLRELAIDLLNSNEYERAIMERRAPNRIVNIGSATTNDPVDYGNPQFRDMLGLFSETGQSWSGFVNMTPDDAMLADPRMNPNALDTVAKVRAQYEDPAMADQLDRIDKYEFFRANNKPIKAFLELGPRGEFSTFEPQGQAFKTRYDPTNVVNAPMPNIDSVGPFGSGLVGRFTSRLENRD